MNSTDDAGVSVEFMGIYDDDGRRYRPDEIDMPPLCQSCAQRAADGFTGVLCQLSWLDHVLTPEDEREPFGFHAYEDS